MVNQKHDVDVIVLNSHGVGQICYVKRLPRRGETMEATNWRVEEDGGKGATVSVALGRLGVKTGYIGKVGVDPWGEMGDVWMSESGVDTTFMYKDPNVSTGTGLIMVDEDGLNTIVDGDSACAALTIEETRAAIDALSSAKYFITGFGMPFQKALDGAKIAKNDYKMITLCNASPLPSEPMGDLSYIDFLILNDVEARLLCHLQEETNMSDQEILNRIKNEYKCKAVIMTKGEKGSSILDVENYWEIPALEVESVDTIGAGDGYLAAFTANLLWGSTTKEAAEWASKYAGYKVTRKGSMTNRKGEGYPQLKEVKEFIEKIDN